MKNLFGILAALLMMSFSGLNVEEIKIEDTTLKEIKTEDVSFFGCHEVVDYIMVAAIEAGDYDGNNAGAIEDWNTLYDVCDILDSI